MEEFKEPEAQRAPKKSERAGAGWRRAPQRVGSQEGGCQLLRGLVFLRRGFQPAGVLACPLESRGLKAGRWRAVRVSAQGLRVPPGTSVLWTTPSSSCLPATPPSCPERFLFSQVSVLQKQPSKTRAVLATLVCVFGGGARVRLRCGGVSSQPLGRPP